MTIIHRGDESLTCACGCGTPVPPGTATNAHRRKGRPRPYAHGHTARNCKRNICGLPERFWAKVRVDRDTGCWNWTACKIKSGYGRGYGRFLVDGTPRPAHVIAYAALRDQVPQGLELDHLCRNRGCCNPEHLEAVTHAVNMARSARAMQTHCINGHEFTPANTYRAKNGTRSCRRCHADYERDRQRAKHSAARLSTA